MKMICRFFSLEEIRESKGKQAETVTTHEKKYIETVFCSIIFINLRKIIIRTTSLCPRRC